ncbi:DUF3999 family protein [Flammeovirgaceae bacterium SG7u.111]|nr:DUF3999 family protein [Flammeovirgaceae bacterium SG7u.132]WPO33820.1 DUF3999 family protein [Flammeovirgaceae bacterium SG7u.111]
MMKLKINILFYLILLASPAAFGQMDKYDYQQELHGISDTWHKIVLPNELFGAVSQNLSDIRIYGITAANDTVEAPYLLRLSTDEVSTNEVSFKVFNASQNANDYYFTFEIPSAEPINQLKLAFEQQNFDWKVQLEGSQNQREWFTLVEDYRILSINNELTDFQFTKVIFPQAKYRYYRILIRSKEKPKLSEAQLSQYEQVAGALQTFSVQQFSTRENKNRKQTVSTISLEKSVPVSYLKIDVEQGFDYYRPVTIEYLTDSIKTEKGWNYHYSTLASGTLNSLDGNEFRFRSTTLQKLRIIVRNGDNASLKIRGVEAKGYTHELVTRFTEPATYILAYGNESARKPNYDIARFTNKIPKEISSLTLGEAIKITKEEAPQISPLFQNKNWLWGIMGTIILVLGFFSFRMMKKV